MSFKFEVLVLVTIAVYQILTIMQVGNSLHSYKNLGMMWNDIMHISSRHWCYMSILEQHPYAWTSWYTQTLSLLFASHPSSLSIYFCQAFRFYTLISSTDYLAPQYRDLPLLQMRCLKLFMLLQIQSRAFSFIYTSISFLLLAYNLVFNLFYSVTNVPKNLTSQSGTFHEQSTDLRFCQSLVPVLYSGDIWNSPM